MKTSQCKGKLENWLQRTVTYIKVFILWKLKKFFIYCIEVEVDLEEVGLDIPRPLQGM
jgi:hypothetical protein